jgi:hypothetical protein
MEAIKNRYNYLFRSTKGLALVGFALVSLTIAIWGTLSGPMDELGISDFVIRILKFNLIEAEREGRIVMLYHTIAMAVIAVEVYFITEVMEMKDHQQRMINATVTFGYILAMVFGLWFGYFGQNPIFHGVYLLGLSLMFFGGLQLAIALWPWKKEYRTRDPAYAQTRSGVDLERVAFFIMAVATIGSSLFGAVAGASWGIDFETVLAEDLIREPHKDLLQLSVIGHLHIMLTLIAVAAALLVGKWVDFKGILHKLAMWLMIIGTIVITLGVWAVVPFEPIAHMIIYGGSTFVLLAGLFLVIFTWDKLIREGTKNLEKPNFWQKSKALLDDPLKFGATWQMVFMNFNSSFIGIYMAVKLDEIFRVWPAREERITLSGHWHILATIVAIILLFYFADLMGLKGKARKWFGWIIIIFSDLAFASATIFAMKRMFVSESSQQPIVDVLMILLDIGLAVVIFTLAFFMFWRLFDLFKKKGRWAQEYADSGTNPQPTEGGVSTSLAQSKEEEVSE